MLQVDGPAGQVLHVPAELVVDLRRGHGEPLVAASRRDAETTRALAPPASREWLPLMASMVGSTRTARAKRSTPMSCERRLRTEIPLVLAGQGEARIMAFQRMRPTPRAGQRAAQVGAMWLQEPRAVAALEGDLMVEADEDVLFHRGHRALPAASCKASAQHSEPRSAPARRRRPGRPPPVRVVSDAVLARRRRQRGLLRRHRRGVEAHGELCVLAPLAALGEERAERHGCAELGRAERIAASASRLVGADGGCGQAPHAGKVLVVVGALNYKQKRIVMRAGRTTAIALTVLMAASGEGLGVRLGRR